MSRGSPTQVSASGQLTPQWAAYLREYHGANASITEQVLGRSTHEAHGTPYEWLRAAVGAEPGAVVDIACGSAPLHDHFTTAQTYVGLDLSVDELHAGRSRGRALLAHADALRLPIASGAADVVVCSMALMLLAPVTQALAEVARILRPGGIFALIRPVATPFHLRDIRAGAAILRGLRRGPQMPQRFGASSLRRSLRSAGLVVASDEALRFSYPLRDLDDARLAMQALYLPDVADARREEAARRLSRLAGPHADLPVSIRRTVAVRRTLDVRSS